MIDTKEDLRRRVRESLYWLRKSRDVRDAHQRAVETRERKLRTLLRDYSAAKRVRS